VCLKLFLIKVDSRISNFGEYFLSCFVTAARVTLPQKFFRVGILNILVDLKIGNSHTRVFETSMNVGAYIWGLHDATDVAGICTQLKPIFLVVARGAFSLQRSFRPILT